MIVSGWDPYEGFAVYDVNSAGFLKADRGFAIGGSGGSFLHGYIDANFTPNMEREQVKELIKSAIALACYRDTSSGGCIRLIDITEKGVVREFIPFTDFKIK